MLEIVEEESELMRDFMLRHALITPIKGEVYVQPSPTQTDTEDSFACKNKHL